jgi:dihydropteroate synthase
MINDVSGWRFDENMLPLISQNPEIKYVLMYGKNASWRADLEENTDKRDILEKMFEFFDERIEKMKKSWISRNQIILDTWMWAFISNDYLDSVKVLQNIQEIKNRYDLPIYIWTSRKWFLSKIVPDNWLQDRLWSSLSSSIYASLNWADFIRVHDVREVRQFIEVFNCLNTSLNDSN